MDGVKVSGSVDINVPREFVIGAVAIGGAFALAGVFRDDITNTRFCKDKVYRNKVITLVAALVLAGAGCLYAVNTALGPDRLMSGFKAWAPVVSRGGVTLVVVILLGLGAHTLYKRVSSEEGDSPDGETGDGLRPRQGD